MELSKEIVMLDEDTALFDDCIFKRVKTGRHINYFRCRRINDKHNKRTLHVAVFIVFSGIIPEDGYTVHHADCNRLNNGFDNLRLMTVGEHIKLHNELDPGRVIFACSAAAKKNKELGYLNAKLGAAASQRMGWPGAKAAAKACSKPVVSLDGNGKVHRVFNSINEAAREMGVAKTSISACASGKCKTIKGFRWAFESGEVSGK